MSKQYTAIQYLLEESLYQQWNTDFLAFCTKEILVDKNLSNNEREYIWSKAIALFEYYKTPEQLSHLFAKWYVDKEGPNVFEEYPIQFKNLIDFLLTNNHVFISPSLLDIKRNELEKLLNAPTY